jgi:hypothetical protein
LSPLVRSGGAGTACSITTVAPGGFGFRFRFNPGFGLRFGVDFRFAFRLDLLTRE